MEDKFLDFIHQQQLFTQADKILLALSGGIDSVFMAYLFKKHQFNFSIAHCNFKLRGEESDHDEEFVKKLASSFQVKLYVNHFDTETYANEQSISIQMAARDLRYNWFEEIRKKEGYNYIAVAHNQNDVIETFFINLIRGTGIKGLTGIKSKNNYIIRPIIFAQRTEIEQYCLENNIKFREDSSNMSTKYFRNKIRHNVMPLLEELNPKINHTIIENIERLTDVEIIYNQAIQEFKNDCITIDGETVCIEIEKIAKNSLVRRTYLFEILQEYGFSNKIINDVIQSLDNISGKTFYSATHRILKDRNTLLISPLSIAEEHTYYIDEGTKYFYNPINLTLEIIEKKGDFKIDKNNKIGYFDLDQLSFPLIVRKWKKGDFFQPFGMQGLKKLSDYFIDQKLSIIDKENVWILASGEKIVWIIGLRTDDRFKIIESTKTILKISCAF